MVADFPFAKIAICGTGLIGGSLALALRRQPARTPSNGIVGIDRDGAALARAGTLGIVDAGATLGDTSALARLLAGVDLLVLAVPVASTAEVLSALLPHLPADALITDVGSTKVEVIAHARAALGQRIGRFVPAHPVAGAERRGADAALATLFDTHTAVLCPLAENDVAAVEHVAQLWQAAGMRTLRMAPDAHDRALAWVSHLPHVLAFAFMNTLLAAAEGPQALAIAGGGFRDFSRIAASNPDIWRDICLSNRDALLQQIDAFDAVLAGMREALANGDGTALWQMFDQARAGREAWRNPRAGEAP